MEDDQSLNCCRCIIKWLDDHGSLVTTFATVMLAVFAFVSINQTSLIINQQKAEEAIRLRAYVGIDAITSTSMMFKNYGLTPAYDLWFETYFIINASTTTKYGHPSAIIIGPGQADAVGISQGDLQDLDSYNISDASGNLYVIDIHYKTYDGQCFLNETRIGGIINSGIKLHDILSQSDTATPCSSSPYKY